MENNSEDCLGCKAVGAVTMSSISAYLLYIRADVPKHNKSQRLFLACFAASTAFAAVYRIANPSE